LGGIAERRKRMEVSVEHDREGRRFHAQVDGHRAVVDYRFDDGVMTITHTGVPQAIEGRGIAAALTRAALEAARAEGWRVDPQCAYAAAYVRRHRQFADLVD
jgi:predicted GNAT family acetyltransferase